MRFSCFEQHLKHENNKVNYKVLLLIAIHTIVGISIAAASLSKHGYTIVYLLIYGIIIFDCALLAKQCVGMCVKKMRIFTPCIVGLTVSLLIAGAVFVLIFLANDQEIKQYDSTVYWIKIVEACQHFSDEPSRFIRRVRNSLAGEYSDLAMLPLIPICLLMGNSFCGFGLSIYIIYYIPFCLLVALYVARIVYLIIPTKAKVSFVIAICASIMLVPMTYPLLCGYVDIVGLVIALLLMHLSLNTRLWNASISDCIYYIILSVLLVFARRWYSFFIVAFYFSIGIEWILEQIRCRRIDYKSFLYLIRNLTGIALMSALLMVALSPDSLKMLLRSDYSLAYSAYKKRPWHMDLLLIAQTIGGFYLIIALIGFVYILFKSQTRILGIKMVVIFTISFAMFERIQSMEVHHRYLITFFVLIWYAVGLTMLITSKCVQYNLIAYSLSIGCMLYNFAQSYGLKNTNQIQNNLFSNIHYHPKDASDFETVRKVCKDIEDITHGSETFYVCSNSELMSSELLARSEMPRLIDATPNMVENNIIDLRDGFPSQLFFADYIITAESNNTNLDNLQKIIQIPLNLLKENSDFAEVYRVISSYQDSNQVVKIYKKENFVTTRLVSILSEELKNAYPDYEYVYIPDYYKALMQIRGAQQIEYDPWEILVKKTVGGRVIVEWNLNQEFESIQCKIANWMTGLQMEVYLDDNYFQNSIMQDDGSHWYEFDTHGVNRLKIIFGKEGDQLSGTIHFIDGLLLKTEIEMK